MIERFVDYLTMSIPVDEKSMVGNEYELIAPIRFYKRGYKTVNGVRFYFGNPNSSKASVVISGFALLFERLNFKNDASMLEYWLKRGATVSRIDLAITEWIGDDFFTVGDVINWYKNQLIESPYIDGGCKVIEAILPDAPRVPETLYIGDISKRGKRGIFRAYDKGLELDLEKHLATRIELESKGDKAHAIARRIAQTNDIAGNFRASFNVNHQTFERLMEAPVADTTRGESLPKRETGEKIASRWNWLIETVAPSLREAIEHDRMFDTLDTNLTKFLIAAGISGDIKAHTRALVDRMIKDATDKIDLLD